MPPPLSPRPASTYPPNHTLPSSGRGDPSGEMPGPFRSPLVTAAIGAVALAPADMYPLLVGIPLAAVLGVTAIMFPSPASVRASIFFVIFMTDLGAAATVLGPSSTYERATVYSISAAGFTATLALGAAATVGAFLIPRRKREHPRAATVAVPLLLAALLLGASHGLLSGVAPRLIASGASTFLWLLMGYLIARRVDVRRTVVTALAAKAMLVIFYFVAGQGFLVGDILRPSLDSFWLAVPLLLSAAVVNFPKMGVPSRLIFSGLAVAASVLSLTRQSWIAMGLAVALLIITAPGLGKRVTLTLASLTGVAVVLAVLTSSATPVAYISRLESIPSVLAPTNGTPENIDLRYSEAHAVVRAVGSQVVWGLGFGSTFDYSGIGTRPLTVADYTIDELQAGRFSQAHIPLVTTYLRLGLFGMLCWFLICVRPILKLVRFRWDPWARMAICGAPLLVLGPWTPKLEFLVGLIVASALNFIQDRRRAASDEN